MLSDQELRARARKTAEDKAGFYIHLGIYVTVNVLLVAVWWFTGGLGIFPWFIFPLFIWGAGVVAHFVGVYRGPAYIERTTEEEYRKLKKQEEESQTVKA